MNLNKLPHNVLLLFNKFPSIVSMWESEWYVVTEGSDYKCIGTPITSNKETLINYITQEISNGNVIKYLFHKGIEQEIEIKVKIISIKPLIP